jgi:hypothetical protein
MRIRVQSTTPDPNDFREIFSFYWQNFLLWLYIFYLDSIRRPFYKRRSRFKKLIDLKGSGKNRIGVVLANGPSINKIDPRKLANFSLEHQADIFCVNYFINTDFLKALGGIDYWVLSDPRHFDLEDPQTVESHANAKKYVRKGVFLPEMFEKKFTDDINKIVFNDLQGSSVFSKNINPLFPRSYLTLTAYKAIALAIHIGYDKIFVAGLDNTHILDVGCDAENRIYRKKNHFYKSKDENDPDNRDYKMGLGKNEAPRNRNMAQEIRAYSRLFGDLYRFSNQNIYNLDLNSLTDAFKKSDKIDVLKT